jgi:hypothetical protein
MSMLRLISRPNALLRRSSSNDRIVDDQRTGLGQRVVGLAQQQALLVKVPVMQDVAHHQHIGPRQWVGEEIAGGEDQPIAEPKARNVSVEDRPECGHGPEITMVTRLASTNQMGGAVPKVADRTMHPGGSSGTAAGPAKWHRQAR